MTMESNSMIDELEELGRAGILEKMWWRVEDFLKDWVHPAWKLKNWLYERYDLVKMPEIRRTEYSDVVERMFYANMQLIKFFIEEEKPLEHVCWYKNDEGNDVGHKYGECKDWPVLFPEYEGKYIMDIIIEIYDWYRFDYVKLCRDRDYLLSFNCEHVIGRMMRKKENNEYSQIVFDRKDCPKSLDDLEGKGIDWETIDKYVEGDRSHVLDERYMMNALSKLETDIEKQKQKYLHLCIEVRNYLWT